AGRKYQREGQVGRAAPKLAVDEIGDAAEENPDRSGRAGDVAEREDGQAAMAREQDHGEHAAEKAAVKRHAALPQLETLQRVRGEIARIVEQDIADPAPEDDAEGHPQHEVVVVGDGHGHRRAPEPLAPDDRACIEPTQQDTDDVGESIPADRERPETDEHGVEGGEGEGVKRHRAIRALCAGVMGAARLRSQAAGRVAARGLSHFWWRDRPLAFRRHEIRQAVDRRKIEMVCYKAEEPRPALRAHPTISIVPAGALNSNLRLAMTQTTNRFFDEMARLMNDAAGVASGVRREFETVFRNQADRILRDLDVVKREEFEAV